MEFTDLVMKCDRMAVRMFSKFFIRECYEKSTLIVSLGFKNDRF